MNRISEIKERLTAIKIAAENNLLAERLRLIGVVVREDAPYLLDENARLNEQVEAFERAVKKESLPGVLCRMCAKTECNDCNNGSDWQFDQERFAGR